MLGTMDALKNTLTCCFVTSRYIAKKMFKLNAIYQNLESVKSKKVSYLRFHFQLKILDLKHSFNTLISFSFILKIFIT